MKRLLLFGLLILIGCSGDGDSTGNSDENLELVQVDLLVNPTNFQTVFEGIKIYDATNVDANGVANFRGVHMSNVLEDVHAGGHYMATVETQTPEQLTTGKVSVRLAFRYVEPDGSPISKVKFLHEEWTQVTNGKFEWPSQISNSGYNMYTLTAQDMEEPE